MQMKLMQYTR